jgi:23S rRNA (guanosine2251-2'-O)-methyltransferase
MKKITLVLDNVRSSFNVGAIFRTADGLGADIDLIGITPTPGSDKKLEKTSLSSLEYVNWSYYKTEEEWLNKLDLNDERLIISIEEGKDFESVSLFDIEKKLRTLNVENIYLIFGHEINGVSDFLKSKSDFILTIPMFGKKNSLNVSTCAGIVGYRIKEILN